MERHTIGEILKKLRIERGLSVAEAAYQSGISPNTLWGYEAEQRTPGILAAIALADTYEVTLDELVGRTPPESQIGGSQNERF